MDTTQDNVMSPDPARLSYEQLLEENDRLRRALKQAQQRIDELTRLIEKVEREGKRQAAPFRKQEGPAKKPKKPGRKHGKRHGRHAHRSVPPRIDETYDVPLPERCPRCGGTHLVEIKVTPQYQTEIPRAVIYRRFDVHVGRCDDCRHTVQGRHELQTSTARGAAGSQLGPGVHALLAILNKQLGLSHGKSVKLLGTMFEELQLARSTSARSCQRTASRVKPAYEQIGRMVRGASEVAPDETGWRVAGSSAWLHVFASPQATYYDIDPTRSREPAARLLGLDWKGTLVHDGWSVYDHFANAFHQQCLGHLQRRCQDLADRARGGAVRFPRAVMKLIDEAFALRRKWRGHRISADALAEAALALSCNMRDLASGRFTNDANRRLADHLLKHGMHWFWFLIDPKIAATNYRAEQAVRPAVVNRKVWGGNRTWRGAETQGILMSVLQTCQQHLLRPFDFLSQALCSRAPRLLPF